MASEQENTIDFFSEKYADIHEMISKRYGIDAHDYTSYKKLPLSLTAEERVRLGDDIIREQQRRGLSTAYEELVMQSRFVDAHRDISSSNDHMQLHSHTFVELLFCMSGNIEYLLGTQRYLVHEGDVLIISPGVSHRPLHSTLREHDYYERIVVWISGRQVNGCRKLWPDNDWSAFLTASEGGTGTGFCLHTDAQPDHQIRDLFRRICLESEQDQPDWEPAVCGLTVCLMVQLSRAVAQAQTLQHSPGDSRRELFDQMIEYVEENLNQKITLEETARQFLISESTLSKTFRTRLNTSFYQFVKQRRLIAAKELLAQTDALSEIPEQVGFSDYSSFYRAFKKEYEMTPSQYRSLVRGE